MTALAENLDRLIDSVIEHPLIPGVSVAVVGADGVEVAMTRGVADLATFEPLTVEHGVRIASSTKPFVASTVMRLMQDGLLSLDDAMLDRLPTAIADLFHDIPNAPAITLRHLLQHTSGLADHSYAPGFVPGLFANPAKEWTAVEQIRLGLTLRFMNGVGERFAYSDTGYVILGQVIEHVTGEPLHQAVRRANLMDALGMSHTFWETQEQPRTTRAHQYFSGVDIYHWNPSIDMFGGGGLVSTPTDIATYWRAWFHGQVHSSVGLQIETMIPTAAPDGSPFSVGDSIGLCVFSGEMGGLRYLSHTGFWGTRDFYFPDIDKALSLFVTHRHADLDTTAAVTRPVMSLLVPS